MCGLVLPTLKLEDWKVQNMLSVLETMSFSQEKKSECFFSPLTFQFNKTKHAMKPHGLLNYLWN